MPTASHVLMIRPVHFGYNAQTAVNNAFQTEQLQAGVQEKALVEFNALVTLLQHLGIRVTVIEDSAEPHTPDSIFPNNWISFHDGQMLFLYPMYAPNRRQERKAGVLGTLSTILPGRRIVDLTHHERENLFLEGTGSMVLDRENRIAYAGLSPRTDPVVLSDFCREAGYRSCVFHASDAGGRLIYHTNVMMCVADRFVVICLESIRDAKEQRLVIDCILSSGKEMVAISLDQMNHFAGNMLQLQNGSGKKFLVMSTAAFESLTPEQIGKLSSDNQLVHSSLTTIETNGGGSARCMMAEIS